MKVESEKCPSYGANLRADTSQESLFCPYCGSRFEPKAAATKAKEPSGKVKVDGVTEKDKVKDVANRFQAAGKFNEAKAYWQKAIAIDPTDGDAHVGYCLASLYLYRYVKRQEPRKGEYWNYHPRNDEHEIFLARQYGSGSKLAELEKVLAKEDAEYKAYARAHDAAELASKKRGRGCGSVVIFLIIGFIAIPVCAGIFFDVLDMEFNDGSKFMIGMIAVAVALFFAIIYYKTGRFDK